MAGGAVRDEIMGKVPKDFDLFILWRTEWDVEKFKEIKETIASCLTGFTESKPVVDWHNSEPYLVATVTVEGHEVQILVNPAQTPEQLLENFDWNVCLFAMTEERTVQQTKIENIGVGKELTLNKVTFPLSTLRRGFRFSERFLMKLSRETVERLCREIIRYADEHMHSGPTGNTPDMRSLAANKLPR